MNKIKKNIHKIKNIIKFLLNNMSKKVNEKYLTNNRKHSKIKKLGGEVIKQISLQEWLPIQKIEETGIVLLKNKKYIKIIQINPINYSLKSDLEKKAILNSYKTFLKTCNFNIQILIQSNKKDLSQHILKIQKNISHKKDKKNNFEQIAEEYIKYIKNINNSKKASSKIFYIIFSNDNINDSKDVIENELIEKYLKIKECLNRCGNEIIEINKKEDVFKIFFGFLNTYKTLKISEQEKEEF